MDGRCTTQVAPTWHTPLHLIVLKDIRHYPE
jgi:hypothetical protein